ncbi:MAG: c-type cytochrome [Planktotalea sp.]|uniref:c-type cytochrome n=1 Tax=Planktotalea sp. TaxID=2029877 RepID=UPI003C7687E8
MSFKYAALLAATVFAAPAFAEGDAAAGEKTFKKCKSCHTIANGDDVIYKGGKTGPNLYGIIGRAAGTQEGFKYGKSLADAGEKGLVWDAENLASFSADPKEFLKEYLDDGAAKSKMSFKLKDGGEDVAAYLESVVAE